MFRRLEEIVDPFACHDNRTPPADVWRFLALALRPLYGVMATGLALNAVGAALEVWLIFYAGRLVDTLAAGTPGRVLNEQSGELLAVAALVLILRPLLSLLREGLDDIAFRPNAEAIVRWRAHQHVL